MSEADGRHTGRGGPRDGAFEDAQTIADRNGLPGFCAWRSGLERRYTVMPPWYWNEQDCRRRYIAHIRTTIDWQERENRINRGNAAFQRSLT
jgi:hypothetical protein